MTDELTFAPPKPFLERPVVCVQGLGFAGAAMAVAVASARDANGNPAFSVVGVERNTAQGRDRAGALSEGRFPFNAPDAKIVEAARAAMEAGNLIGTVDPVAYEQAELAIVDVPLDVADRNGAADVDFTEFRVAIRTLGERLPVGALVLVETTVPPGTCENVVARELTAALAQRNEAEDAILLAHSYERVMPGPDYFDSIVNYWRVYAGASEAAADRTEDFLSQIINVADYPLRRLSSMTASETAKVMENTYRAVNIAFAEEWGRLAEAIGIDIFEVIDAIRDRPTHANLRQPGFGVGGYCLSKDPLFPEVSGSMMGLQGLEFPFGRMALAVNRRMPIENLDRIDAMLGGLEGKSLLLMGIAYRSEVDDTRHAPAETFYRGAEDRGARLRCHDPFVREWRELGLPISDDLPDPAGADAVVFAVPHAAYRRLDVLGWLGAARPLVYDCDRVLADETRRTLRNAGVQVESTGRGLGQ